MEREHGQFLHEVHVADYNVAGHLEWGRSEIQYRPDAHLNEFIGHLLGGVCGHSNYPDPSVKLLVSRTEVGHVANVAGAGLQRHVQGESGSRAAPADKA